jgi:hypothetical protein
MWMLLSNGCLSIDSKYRFVLASWLAFGFLIDNKYVNNIYAIDVTINSSLFRWIQIYQNSQAIVYKRPQGDGTSSNISITPFSMHGWFPRYDSMEIVLLCINQKTASSGTWCWHRLDCMYKWLIGSLARSLTLLLK